MSRYQPPEPLAARYQLAGFHCRSQEQTACLVEVAKQAHGTGTTRVFVVTHEGQGLGAALLLLLRQDIRRTLGR